MYIYDAPLPIATGIFELFLVEGEQVILDLIASLLETQYSEIIAMEETELMEYLRKDIVRDSFNKRDFAYLMKGFPRVK